eukprot:Sspe_Gene.79895::Locus_50215_Transcript_2_2_Confidence_0.667_Length_1803::g.79895::m.79895
MVLTALGTSAYDNQLAIREESGTSTLHAACAVQVARLVRAGHVRVHQLSGFPPCLLALLLRLLGPTPNHDLLSLLSTTPIANLSLAGLEGLDALPSLGLSLTTLDLEGTSITFDALKAVFSSTPSLTALNVQRCPGVTSDRLWEYLVDSGHGSRLRALGVYSMTEAPESGWEAFPKLEKLVGVPIASRHPALRELQINTQCPKSIFHTDSLPLPPTSLKMTGKMVSHLPFDPSELRSFELWCEAVTECGAGTALGRLATSTHLTKLSISLIGGQEPKGLADELVEVVLPALPVLEELVLDCHAAVDPRLLTDVSYPLTLRALKLGESESQTVTSPTLEGVRYTEERPCPLPPRLQTITLQNHPTFAPGTVRAICRRCPQLLELVLIDLDISYVDVLSEVQSASLQYLEVLSCGEPAFPPPENTVQFDEFLTRCPALNSMMLYGVAPLPPASVHILAAQLKALTAPTALAPPLPPPATPPLLTYLNISDDQTASAEEIRAMVEYLAPTLKTLQLEYCSVLAPPPSGLLALEELTLRSVRPLVSDRHVEEVATLLRRLPTLRRLFVELDPDYEVEIHQ